MLSAQTVQRRAASGDCGKRRLQLEVVSAGEAERRPGEVVSCVRFSLRDQPTLANSLS